VGIVKVKEANTGVEQGQIMGRYNPNGAAMNRATLVPVKRCGYDATRFHLVRLCISHSWGRCRRISFSESIICMSRGVRESRGTDLDKLFQQSGDLLHQLCTSYPPWFLPVVHSSDLRSRSINLLIYRIGDTHLGSPSIITRPLQREMRRTMAWG
jgi:hypothetical protein